mmetsp:Transcript_3949/g.5145  ORF Transcript_3949/g.5145 Transcript_3949/m.5145 type:complete len:411 (-) Transcript_3949:73-1305(-)
MVDSAQGGVEKWRLVQAVKADIQPEPAELANHFWSDEIYYFLYSPQKGAGKGYVYNWQGQNAPKQDKGQKAMFMSKIAKTGKSRSIDTTPKYLVQMKESVHFHMMFQKRFIIHKGRQCKPKTSFSPSLYHVQGFRQLGSTIKAVEVDCKATLLSPQGVFILQTQEEQWIWRGSGSTKEAFDVALSLAPEISKIKKTKHSEEPIVVGQGQELQDFWAAIPSGKQPIPNGKGFKKRLSVRLFEGSSASGSFSVKEVHKFSQRDLHPDNVYMLDGVHHVYIWFGPWSSPSDVSSFMGIAAEYVGKASDGRLQSTPVIKIEAGEETQEFCCLFHAWDQAKRPKKGKFVNQSVCSQTYPLPLLTSPNPPKGLDTNYLESYLSDEEFFKVFDRSKSQFSQIPDWVQIQKLRDVGLL